MKRLQERIGHSPGLEIEHFENWAGTYSADVISCSPISKEEMQKVIAAANEEGVKLRCTGSSHSWSPVFSDDHQLLMRLGKVRNDYGHGAKIRISNVRLYCILYKHILPVSQLIRKSFEKKKYYLNYLQM